MKNCMKKVILSALILISMTGVSFSQSDNSQTNDTKAHSQYLQVGFINETALYIHSSLSPTLNLKSGISANWNYDETKDGSGYWRNQNSPSPLKEEKLKSNDLRTNYEIIASSLLMYNINAYEYAQFYFGFGPSLSYSLTKYSNSSSNYTDTTYNRNGSASNYTVLGIGPSVSFSIKTKLIDNLFLISDYNLTVYYTWNTYTYSSTNESKYAWSTTTSFYTSQNHQESNGWKLRFTNIKVGLLIAL